MVTAYRTSGDAWIVDLFETYYLTLVRLAAQLVDTQESAEEVVQDVFTAVYRRGQSAAPAEPERYLKAAVVNRSRSILRWRMTHRRSVRALGGDLRSASQEGSGGSLVDSMQDGISALPRRQREVLVLRYYEGLAPAEVAQLLGISATAVNASLHRALESLKTLLTSEVKQ